MSKSMSILGDSVLQGITLNESGKYVLHRQLETELAASVGFPVNNFSHMGYTTDMALKRSLVSKLAGGDEQIVLIEFGGNDCDFNWQEISEAPMQAHDCKVPLARFQENYRKLIASVKATMARPVAMSLMPIDAKRYFSWFCRNGVVAENVMAWLKDVNIIYRWQEMYSMAICQLARDEHIPLIDLRTPFLSIHNIGEYLCADGIHPTVLGQKLLCNTIREQLGTLA